MKKKLKNVGHTTWVEQITGLKDFEDLYISVIFCLESMNVDEWRICNRESSTKASSFYELIASFDFIATFILAGSFLDLTVPAAELLQENEIDLANATHFLDFLECVTFSKRNAVD